MTIDPSRRWVLRKAYEASDYNFSSLGRVIGCKHPTVKTLLFEPDELNSGSENPKSTELYTRLCLTLGVPCWMVMKGIRPEQRDVIEALERLRELAPDKYDEFIKATVEAAEDKAARAGWKPDGDEDDPPAPKRSRRPTLRTVR